MSIERLGALAANFQTALNEYNMRTGEVTSLEEQLAQATDRQHAAYERLKGALSALQDGSAVQASVPAPARANGRA